MVHAGVLERYFFDEVSKPCLIDLNGQIWEIVEDHDGEGKFYRMMTTMIQIRIPWQPLVLQL